MKDKTWAVVAVGFGCVLALGAGLEIASVVSRELLPKEAAQIPFMARHHSEVGLRFWVGASNAFNLACAGLLLSAGWRLWHGRSAWRRIAASNRGLFWSTACSVPVWLWYALPMDGTPLFLLLSMAGASVGMLALTALWRQVALRRVT